MSREPERLLVSDASERGNEKPSVVGHYHHPRSTAGPASQLRSDDGWLSRSWPAGRGTDSPRKSFYGRWRYNYWNTVRPTTL